MIKTRHLPDRSAMQIYHPRNTWVNALKEKLETFHMNNRDAVRRMFHGVDALVVADGGADRGRAASVVLIMRLKNGSLETDVTTLIDRKTSHVTSQEAEYFPIIAALSALGRNKRFFPRKQRENLVLRVNVVTDQEPFIDALIRARENDFFSTRNGNWLMEKLYRRLAKHARTSEVRYARSHEWNGNGREMDYSPHFLCDRLCSAILADRNRRNGDVAMKIRDMERANMANFTTYDFPKKYRGPYDMEIDGYSNYSPPREAYANYSQQGSSNYSQQGYSNYSQQGYSNYSYQGAYVYANHQVAFYYNR